MIENSEEVPRLQHELLHVCLLKESASSSPFTEKLPCMDCGWSLHSRPCTLIQGFVGATFQEGQFGYLDGELSQQQNRHVRDSNSWEPLRGFNNFVRMKCAGIRTCQTSQDAEC